MKVCVILTCFNRKEKTITCINALKNDDVNIDVLFIVVDDCSTDGTVDAIKKLDIDAVVIEGTGNLFWAGGMRRAINEYLSIHKKFDYVLFVNDDVEFFPDTLSELIDESKDMGNSVIVGATCDADGEFTYGAIRISDKKQRYIYYDVMPGDKTKCDTFNCNCVLFPAEVLDSIGTFDSIYTHAIADLDYGLRVSRTGYSIFSSKKFVGVCERNAQKGTWKDTSLKRLDRIKKKESPKGPPTKEWFHFVKKYFGVLKAIKYAITPYIRILFGR